MQKTILRLCLVLSVIVSASCVSTKTQHQMNQLNQALHEQAIDAAMRGNFVLEANRVMYRHRNPQFVTSSTNFIAVERGRVTIQTASNWGWPGPNSLGGITYDARLTSLRINTDRRGNLHIVMHAHGIVFSGRIEVTVFAGSNVATARVNPTFRGRNLTFDGVVVPAENSHIFRGRSL